MDGEENVPLLTAPQNRDAQAPLDLPVRFSGGEVPYQGEGSQDQGVDTGGESVSAAPIDVSTIARGGPTVTCRVCEHEIPLEGRSTQHVVRCANCNEVTPIRAAPPGKKYVRCPCNCLLVCKASSNRIACPRANCRRVITLVASEPVGTAVRAPAGTCRVQCVHCQEMFMFNTLVNNVAHCPHCKKSSSVGARFARSRAVIYLVCFAATLFILIGVILGTSDSGVLAWMFWVLLILAASFFAQRGVYYSRMQISQVLGPI